ncbi:SRPBCC domain-containing protein [Mucilaginibacter corticis]|uniref:SRPBCC domain-containing protein n=1 Tax=Mucilaginibacter corticis TaxID=2597670 RepID=A0A556MIA7_9SPHI|nr:SRPBCC domain-containing protein [Mucilaginibacter corticis]TSJ39646.1 SRPBCC domain-containing protein [Mucilaginibacter corticis]
MAKIIKHQYFFSHPVETVWEYLTNSELMGQWLMKNNFEPVVGHEFQFRTGGKANLNFDGIFYCKVLEIDPLKKLVYSWNCGPGEGKITLESVVTWQLEAKENGTEVFLDHRGFNQEENLDMYHGLMHGWLEKFQNIEKLLNPAKDGNTNA